MPTMLFWGVMVAAAIFGFLVIGGGMKAYMSRQENDATGSTHSSRSKGAREE